MCRTTFETWAEEGGKLMGQRVKEKLNKIMQGHQTKPLPEEIKDQISKIIKGRMPGSS